MKIVRKMFSRLGYTVTAVGNSRHAMALFKDDPEEFDLVITDQSMPHMTGLELARHMMTLRPDNPVILCAGYSETVSETQAKMGGIQEFIIKPFTQRSLAGTVREILDKKQSN